MDSRVKTRWIVSAGLAMVMACGVAHAQKGTVGKPAEESEVTSEPVPPQVIAAASAAVAKLGDEVVLGRYQVAVERMYPLWKERAAKRMGGMDVLEKQLAGVGAQMVQQGISIISFKPQGPPRAYEVVPGTKVVKENGVSVSKLVYTKWMVLVPTVRKIRIQREGVLKAVVIESTGYQVAISDKGRNDWTFMDGADLKLNDLRGLFVTLPQNLELPPVEQRESR
jgi:hypothetical protein